MLECSYAILCPLEALRLYKQRVLDHLALRLKQHSNPLRFYIVVKCELVRPDSEGGVQLEKLYRECGAKINRSFEEFCREGSGMRVKSIIHIRVGSGIFSPPHGSSYIKTPEGIKGKKAIINIMNRKDHRYFEYSVIAAQHYHELNVWDPSCMAKGDHTSSEDGAENGGGDNDGDDDVDDDDSEGLYEQVFYAPIKLLNK